MFARLFGRRPPPQMRRSRAEAQQSPFLAFLGQVARAIETGSAAAPAPPEPVAEAPEGTFRREVERRLEPLLERGQVRIEAVARALGCSRQTLYRRLKAEGVTFAALLDALRHRLALRYIEERGLPVKDAAYRLGFSEPAAFSRAYKRWTGSSPRRMNG
jgi:AraC-like DNA-binding protein